MERETVRLTKQENQRALLLESAQRNERTNKEIAQALGLSVRQVQRLKKVLLEEGPAGLAHGNRDRTPSNALSEDVAERIVDLYKGPYKGFNFSHFQEKLSEVEGMEISLRSVRRTLQRAGFASPRKRKTARHRSRRERRSREGAMLQIDGSPHDWLEGRGPRMCLIGGIDDATGKVAGAVFREYEDAHGYFLMMRQVVSKHGIPETVYRDKHGIFERDQAEEDELWEQLAGRREPTQFGRLMEELGIRQIAANSPQAKGRVERLWATFQDRLVSELRLANVCTLEEANEVLKRVVSEHNRRFARKPRDPESVYRQLEKRLDMDRLFCFKYRRKVAKDNTVIFFGNTIQIGPGPGGSSYAGCVVEVQERFNGSLYVYHHDKPLAKTEPPPLPPATIRVRRNNGRYTQECPWTAPKPKKSKTEQQPAQTDAEPKSKWDGKPAPNHPWRRSWGDRIARR